MMDKACRGITAVSHRKMRKRGYSIRLLLLSIPSLLSMVCPTAESSITASPQISMGTTILAVRYRHGVILGADTRTSASTFVSNRYAEKISMVFGEHNSNSDRRQQVDDEAQEGEGNHENDKNNETNTENMHSMPCIVLCRSGSAADTQYLADQVKWELQIRFLRHGIKPTVKQAAHLVRSIMREQGSHFSASLICAGFDCSAGDEHIYSILPGGSLLKENAFAVSGSGSTFIVGHMDHHLVNVDPLLMEEEDAVKFVVKAVSLAISRDSSSGGFVRIYVLDKRRGLRSFIASPRDPSRTVFEH